MPSATERRISWVVLSVLPLIAGAVYVKGRHFDPDLFTLNPAALAAPARTPVEAPAAAPRIADPELPGSARRTPPDPTTSASPVPLPSRLTGLDWNADAAPEQFTPETLYQKIDGRADEYLKDGFARLETISYARGAAFIDVFVYDMGSEPHARARYAAERPRAAAPFPAGRDGYCVAASCFFTDGRYYAQVIGSDAAADVERAVRQAATGVADLMRQRQP